ncbi:MAG: capsule assembly Wzi family protein [Alphaproteobacteria bacterium]
MNHIERLLRSLKRSDVRTGAFVLALLTCTSAGASPWLEVGDAQQRSDVEVLNASGALHGITTQWPLPWRDVTGSVGDLTDNANSQVAAAARRLDAQTQSLDRNSYSLSMDVDSTPSFVRGFDAMGREKFQGQISAEFVGGTTAVRISAGAQVKQWNQRADLLLDGSYIAQKVGPVLLYAGSISHWWGPGWFSALSLSNNARPFPQIGIERISTTPFKSPWLSWIGPWQAEFFVGVLDGPRVARNTVYDGLRITISPLPGLELGIARTDEMCGTGHPCQPFVQYFDFQNDPTNTNKVNDEGLFDIKYSNRLFGLPFEIYGQVMNEDNNPINHSGTSHLVGGSIWPQFGDWTARLTAEYTSSIPTLNIFSGPDQHGFAYNNFQYADGMRYRGRTLGFSLDSDSRLSSIQLSLTAPNSFNYSLTYHHAIVSTPQAAALGANILTTSPVTINLAEARITMPFSGATVELAGRYQDDQLRPKTGSLFSFEAALTFRR